MNNATLISAVGKLAKAFHAHGTAAVADDRTHLDLCNRGDAAKFLRGAYFQYADYRDVTTLSEYVAEAARAAGNTSPILDDEAAIAVSVAIDAVALAINA